MSFIMKINQNSEINIMNRNVQSHNHEKERHQKATLDAAEKAAANATESAVAVEDTVEDTAIPDMPPENEETANEVPAETSEFTKIEELEKQLEAEKNRYLLLMADFQNYRKRTAKELNAARLQGLYETVTPFTKVFDYLQMATKAAAESDNVSAIRTGMDMITNEYQKALDELGITMIQAVGENFNPAIHEAVAHEASEEPEGKVIRQWSCGYQLGERLLRPAKVVVSSGNEPKKDGE